MPTTIGYGLVAYRAATGAQLWTKTYAAGVSGFVSPDFGLGSQVIVSPDGRKLFIIGYSGATRRDPDFLTVAYQACRAGQAVEVPAVFRFTAATGTMRRAT